MSCKNETDDTKFGGVCKKRHEFCMEEHCPDYEPAEDRDEE